MIASSNDNQSLENLRGSEFQRDLTRFNRGRLDTAEPTADWLDKLQYEARFRIREGQWIEAERAVIAAECAAVATDPQGFVAWFEALEKTGPGQHDALFGWLETTASLDDMRWFLTQEVAGEAGFDDLVALTQVKLPNRAKMELARNYWDEMGRGNQRGMHGPMLDALAETLDLQPTIETTLAESLALANTMVAFATSRRYVWHSVGALGVIELTAPARAAAVAKGLKRLGLSERERRYFDLHAVLDVAHSKAWNAEALIPIVSERPDVARFIAEGALMRLACGERCFAAYRAQLWSSERLAA